MYEASVVQRKQLDFRGVIWSQMDIFYSTKVVATIEEKPGYDFSTFVADMGGSLGFLLGLSVLGFITILEKICVMATRERQSGKVKNKSQKRVVIMEDAVLKY